MATPLLCRALFSRLSQLSASDCLPRSSTHTTRHGLQGASTAKSARIIVPLVLEKEMNDEKALPHSPKPCPKAVHVH